MLANSRPTVVHVVHSLEGGGTERMLVALLRSFNHSRWRHVVVTLRDAGNLAGELPHEVGCRPIGSRGRSWSAGLRLAGIVRRLRANVIHARNVCCWSDAVTAGLLSKRARVVLGFHGLESGGSFARRARLAVKGAVALGGVLTGVGESGRRMIIDQLGIAADRVFHLPNGVDGARFGIASDLQRKAARASLGISNSAWVVGAVGSLAPVKGFDVLLEAAARLASRFDDLRLLIVGDGPLRRALESEAAQLGIADRTLFAGRCDDVAPLLHAMDAFVCCSRSEGMSNSLLEALASGLPVIATAVGDNPMLIRDRIDGIIVPPNEPVELADALGQLRASATWAAQLASAARLRATAFDFRRAVARYEGFYDSLVRRSEDLAEVQAAPAMA